MQHAGKYYRARLGVGRLSSGITRRWLQANVLVREEHGEYCLLCYAVVIYHHQHYYEAQIFLQEAIERVATAFSVEPHRVVPLQLRPDDREPTRCTIWTFTIRGILSHDILGQMREMFEHSKDAFGEWRFGSRKVHLEPIVTGLPGVLNDVSFQILPTVWQRPGVDAEWEQEAELWIKLRNFKWLEELRSSVSQFERRLLNVRDAVASAMKMKDPRALQVAKYYTTSDGTIIRMTPATPDRKEHIEQLKSFLLAFEEGKLNEKLPELAKDFWPIRNPETGKPQQLPASSSTTSTSTSTPPAYRVVVRRHDHSYDIPKAPLVVEKETTPSKNQFPVTGIAIVVALLVVLLSLLGLCIFCCRRRRKATSKSAKPAGSPAATGSVKAKAGSSACTATTNARQQQAGGAALTSSSKRKGYAGSVLLDLNIPTSASQAEGDNVIADMLRQDTIARERPWKRMLRSWILVSCVGGEEIHWQISLWC
ncbi:uncharacterized protein EMH_0005810 [Eimeria mitis]|uniref:Uncharacterized protein n=1 Tax=Eimeria mitis TaxID=44415 RepID=U6JZN3_9EIME|nr:uncharacterized protein EMH_0005810 [Eimeria mitis]CDJ30211.1 hypothetical protein, conserved [Eimeria mitis]